MKVLLGMSGGLDSTYAARALQEKAMEVEGAVLKMHEYTDVDGARRSAESLGIPLHVIDCTNDFLAVKNDLVSCYANGKTPNPCIICNREVKFKRLYDFAMANGFDRIATGHYAKIVSYEHNGSTKQTFARAIDSKKDQTYMLYRLPSYIVEKLLLPLADLEKSRVRELAMTAELSFDNKESQEICFLPQGGHVSYVEQVVGMLSEGDFIDDEGRTLGRHKGIAHYTIGQRKGLGIALGARYFVTRIDPNDNTVTLSDAPKLSTKIYLDSTCFLGIDASDMEQGLHCQVKIRYLAPAVDALARLMPDSSVVLELSTPVASVAPGQSAVLYDGDVLLGGGFIVKSE